MDCESCGGLTYLDDDLGMVCRNCYRTSITRPPTEAERTKRGFSGKHIPTERKADREIRELARQFAIM